MSWPKLKRDAVGLRVRTTTELRNYHVIIPAGSVLTVAGWRTDELELHSDPCEHCGVRVIIRKVSISWVELIEE